MAKRRMRRTRSIPAQSARNTGSLTEGFVDQARTASVGMVHVATEAAKAALSGMQQVGRSLADMAAPAARRSMGAAADAGRAAVEGAGDISRSMRRATPTKPRRKRRAA